MDLRRTARRNEARKRREAEGEELLFRERLREQADRRAAETKKRAEGRATDANGVVAKLEEVHATLTGLGVGLLAACQEEGSMLIYAAAQALAVARRRQARLRQQD